MIVHKKEAVLLVRFSQSSTVAHRACSQHNCSGDFQIIRKTLQMHDCFREDHADDHLSTRDPFNTFGSFVTFGSFRSKRAWKHSQHKKSFSLLILHSTRSNMDQLVRMNWHNNQLLTITNHKIKSGEVPLPASPTSPGLPGSPGGPGGPKTV